MRTMLKKATLGVALGAAALTSAVPADAQYYRYRHRHDSTGPAIVAGVAGLAIGAAIASSNRRDRYYDRGYYNDRYYDDGYNDRYYYDRYYNNGYRRGYYRDGYYGGYDRCYVRRVYDPYIGRSVRVRYC